MATRLPKQIAIIDTAIQGCNAIAANIDHQRIATILVDHSNQSLASLLQDLDRHAPADSIHIISHGSPAALHLGKHCITSDNLTSYSEFIHSLSSHLAPKGEILLYGCYIAEGATGQSFIDTLADTTGASIAASHSLTAAESQGGNTQLEYRSGIINTQLLLSNSLLEATGTRLAAPVIKSNLFSLNLDTTLHGATAGEYRGQQVDILRDINGDGYDEILTASYQWDPSAEGNQWNTGKVEIISGQDYSVLKTFTGNKKWAMTGFNAHVVGDLNKDGIEDFAYTEAGRWDKGKLTVISGATLTPLPMVSMEGGSKNERAYFLASGMGDLNNDGVNDLLIAALNYNLPGTNSHIGKIYARSGKNGNLIYSIEGNADSRFSGNPAFIGDINNDGHDDFAVRTENPDHTSNVVIISGQSSEVLHTLNGESRFDYFGRGIRAVGDLNKDGYNEIVITAHGYSSEPETQNGRIYLYSGKDLALIGSKTGQKEERLGAEILGNYDINKDGIDDIFISGYGRLSRGSVHALSGEDLSILKTIIGSSYYNPIASSGSIRGDINNDGHNDLVIGHPKLDTESLKNSGAIHTYLSSSAQAVYIENGPASLLHSAPLFIDDTDGSGFNNGKLHVEITNNLNPETDILMVENQGLAPGEISLNGNKVSYEGIEIGIVKGGADGDPLIIDFNSSATITSITSLIQALSFQSSRENLNSSPLHVEITLTDSRTIPSAPLLIDVIPEGLNDAPTILAGFKHQLYDISKNLLSVHNKGTPLSDIIDWDALSDPDGTKPQAIAITAVNNENGSWEYSKDNGHLWNSLTIKDGHKSWSIDSSSIILSIEKDDEHPDLIRFIPKRDFSGTASLTFRAFDKSQFKGSNVEDLSTPGSIGGNTPFSSDQGTITVKVTDTNDTPRINSEKFSSNWESVFTEGPGEHEDTALVSAGDINNDGSIDLQINPAHPDADYRLIRKGTPDSNADLIPLLVLPLQGESFNDVSGKKLVNMGDLDGDSHSDFALASTHIVADGLQYHGRIDIVSGQTGEVIRSIHGDADNQRLGYQIINAGDLNNDGINDLIASAFITTPDYQKHIGVRYYSGADGSLIREFMRSVSDRNIVATLINATDINNDGVDDLLLGIAQLAYLTGKGSGITQVISGADGTLLLDIPATGTSTQARRGVNIAGDYNHDGTMDFMVSDASGSSAWVTIYSGKDASPLLYIEGLHSKAFGQLLSPIGDTNFDGVNDYLIGSTTTTEQDEYKRIGLYSGKDGTLLSYIDPGNPLTYLYHSLAPTGDLDHDGLEDFLISDGRNSAHLYSHNIPSQITTENSPAIQIHPESVTVTDDDSHFDGGTLQLSITDAQRASLSQLVVLDQGLISVAGNTVSHNGTVVGTLSGGTAGTPLQIALNAQATPAVTEALIQALGFVITGDTNTDGLYTLLIELTDPAGATSQALPVRITVSEDNDIPELQHLDGDTANYTIGGSAVALDSGSDALIIDPDSSDFDGGILTVTLGNSSDATADNLQLLSQGDIQLSGSDVQYQGKSAGTLSGGNNGVPLSITLTGDATPAAVEAMVWALHYHNADPVSLNTATRTATLTLSDGDGGSAVPVQMTIELTRLPTLDLDTTRAGSGYSTNFIEAGAAIAIAQAGAVFVSDDGTFTQLKVTLSNHPDGSAEQLSSTLGSGSQTLNGEPLTLSPYDPATGTLLITLDSGTATAATMEQLIASIRYQNTALNPDTQSRSISFVATDNDNQISTAVVTQLSVNDNNAEPTLSATSLNPEITAQRGSQPLFDQVSIDTIEPGQTLNGLTLEVSPVQDPGDEYLLIDNQLFDLTTSSAPVVTLEHGYSVQVTVTGSRALISIQTDFSNNSPAEIQTLLETLHYQHSGHTPTTGAARTISLSTLTDNGGGSDTNSTLAVSSTVTVHQNQQPDSADASVQLGYNSSYPFQLSDFSFSDPDSNDQLTAITITALPDQGTLSLNGNPVAQFSTVTASQISAGLLSFIPVAGGQGNSYSQFEFTVSDGLINSDNSTLTINVAPPPPPPHEPEPEPATGESGFWQDGVWVRYPSNDDLGLYELVVDTAPEGRIDNPDSQHPDHADIPIVKHTQGINELINVALPAGIAIHTLSTNTAGSEQYLLPFVEGLLEDKEQSDKADIIQGTQAFLQNHDEDTLQVGQITLTGIDTTPGNLPVIIQGPPGPESNHGNTIALTIDARQLPAGTVLQLDHVDFAVVVGPATLNGGQGENIVYTGSGSQHIRLGPEDDTLHGGSDDDIIGSDGGDDQVYGSGGNDILFGGNGADQLHGGPGLDTARYDAPLSHYTINQHQGHTTLEHKTRPTGPDTLINIEQIQFADQTLTVNHTQNQAILATLYTKALQRQPDLGGFNWWQNSIEDNEPSSGEIALSFLRSPEYKQLHGTQLDQLNLEQQIDTLYRGLLGREADHSGKAFWLDAAENGLNLPQIADHFMHSEELSAQYLNPEHWNFLV